MDQQSYKFVFMAHTESWIKYSQDPTKYKKSHAFKDKTDEKDYIKTKYCINGEAPLTPYPS